MSILSRYLLKLHAGPFAFALGAVTGVMLINQVAKRMPDLVGKGLPWSVIVEVFALSIPFIVALSLPMAVLIAVLFAVSRLTGDSEVTALRAGGVSLWRLQRPLLLAGIVLTALAFLFNDQLLPRSNHRLRTLYTDIARKKPTFSLKEQVINEVQKNRFFLRAAFIDPATYALRDVSIYDLSVQDRKQIIYADSGYLALTPDQEDAHLTLFTGTMHEFDRSDPTMFQQVTFARDLVRIEGVGNELRRTLMDTYKSEREMGICEMERQVGAARREQHLAERRAAAVSLNGLRNLVGLAQIPADTLVPEPRPGPYCRALGRWATWALPQELRAQEPRRDSLPRFPVAQVTRRAPAPHVTGAAVPPSVRGSELRTYQDRARQSRSRAARLLVEIHKKYVISVACLVFVLLGVPTAIRFPRGGLGLVLGAGFVIFGFYYIVLIAGESLADRLAAPPGILWTANALFTVAALILHYRTRTAARPPRFRRVVTAGGST